MQKVKQEKHNQPDKEETEISKYMWDLTDNPYFSCVRPANLILGAAMKILDEYK